MEDLRGTDLDVTLESLDEIRKLRINHDSSRSTLYGFMGQNEDMAIRFERVLFWNLAGHVRKVGGSVGYIQNLKVPDRWQGQGIGSTLLTEALRVMGEAGIQGVYLDVVPADSGRFEDLMGFYDRHGFVVALDCAEDQYPPPFIMKADLRRFNDA